jgi:hypothetical protein
VLTWRSVRLLCFDACTAVEERCRTMLHACRDWHNWLGFSAFPGIAALPAPSAAAAAVQGGGRLEPAGFPPDSSRPSTTASGSSSSSGSSCGRCLLASPELLDLGACLPASEARQLLTLTNVAGVALGYAWRLGVFEPGRAIVSGRLAITPASGARVSVLACVAPWCACCA